MDLTREQLLAAARRARDWPGFTSNFFCDGPFEECLPDDLSPNEWEQAEPYG